METRQVGRWGGRRSATALVAMAIAALVVGGVIIVPRGNQVAAPESTRPGGAGRAASAPTRAVAARTTSLE